jgi:mono/diheme cytochrome c family protein
MSAERPPRPSLRRIALIAGAGLLALFALIQLVPYGRDHANPPVTKAAALDPGTRAIVTETCADCHSNTTRWPWYTSVAPASWFARSDVDGGRKVLNFSEWDRAQPAVDELAEVISSGQMPPRKYRILPNHAKARLADAEKARLIAGLRRLYATDPPAAIKEIGTQRRQ